MVWWIWLGYENEIFQCVFTHETKQKKRKTTHCMLMPTSVWHKSFDNNVLNTQKKWSAKIAEFAFIGSLVGWDIRMLGYFKTDFRSNNNFKTDFRSNNNVDTTVPNKKLIFRLYNLG